MLIPSPLEILLVAVVFLPVTPWHHTYVPVAASADEPPDHADLHRESWWGGPDHVVVEGALFQRVHSTRSSLLLVYVDRPRRSRAR